MLCAMSEATEMQIATCYRKSKRINNGDNKGNKKFDIDKLSSEYIKKIYQIAAKNRFEVFNLVEEHILDVNGRLKT